MKVHAHITDTTVRLFSADTLKLVGERLITDLPPGTRINDRIKDWLDVLEVEVVSTKEFNDVLKVTHNNVRIIIGSERYFGEDRVHMYIDGKGYSTMTYMTTEEAREVIMAMNLALANIA